MKKITDLGLINAEVLGIALLPDESNEFEDPADISLTWQVTEFSPRSMKIQIEWQNVYQVSSGSQRDYLNVTVIDSDHFFSANLFQKIPLGTNHMARVPTMMPKSDFTESYTKVADAA